MRGRSYEAPQIESHSVAAGTGQGEGLQPEFRTDARERDRDAPGIRHKKRETSWIVPAAALVGTAATTTALLAFLKADAPSRFLLALAVGVVALLALATWLRPNLLTLRLEACAFVALASAAPWLGLSPGATVPWLLVATGTTWALLRRTTAAIFTLPLLAVAAWMGAKVGPAPPTLDFAPTLNAVLTAAPIILTALLSAHFVGSRQRLVRELGAEIARREEAEVAERLSLRERENFLARIVHDLRTPMNGVVGLSDLLLRSQLSPEQRTQLSLISRQGDLFLALVDDFLDFARLSAQKLELHPRDFDLRSLLDESAQLLAPVADEKGLATSIQVESTIPDRLYGDSTRLRQIVLNLLGNAVKYTRSGRVELIARAERRDNEASLWLNFAVRDTGRGLSAGQLQRLFRPFTRLNEVESDRIVGTGLGLVIARSLAELMGGTLSAESVPGEGSTFRFSLPFRVGQSSASSTPRSMAIPVWPWGEKLDLLVLVVEDDLVNRKVLEAQLRLIGLKSEQTESGLDAIERFSTGRFCTVLLDCDLPDIDGFEVARRIRERELPGKTHTPVIAITASASAADGQRLRNAGIDALLVKPYRLADLVETLSRWLPDIQGPPTRSLDPPDAPPTDGTLGPLDPERLSALEELAPAGDSRLVVSLLQAFRESAPALARSICEAIARGDSTREVTRFAHQLHGSSANLGAQRVQQLARAIELGSRAEVVSAEVRGASEMLEFAIEESLEALERWASSTGKISAREQSSLMQEDSSSASVRDSKASDG